MLSVLTGVAPVAKFGLMVDQGLLVSTAEIPQSAAFSGVQVNMILPNATIQPLFEQTAPGIVRSR